MKKIILVLSVLFFYANGHELNASKKILVTGGAGYIGSHTAQLLHASGYQVIILDTLHHNQTFKHPWAEVIKGDVGDSQILTSIFQTHEIDAVMHFAGSIEVGLSMTHPSEFYQNNVTNTLRLLDTMRAHGVKKCIFASSCSVFGSPVYVPMDEKHPLAPVSPYAKTKLAVEYALQDYANTYDLRYVVLRYFNAAGASPELDLGEQHEPETHVIPLLLRAIQNDTPFTLFGTDYDTPDGTCIRDYIHVKDIAQAHVQALNYLDKGGESDVFNLGSGTGYSVRQLIDVATNVCRKQVKIVIALRRAGDTSTLVANAQKAKDVLGWVPEYSGLENIVASAWLWEQKKDRRGL